MAFLTWLQELGPITWVRESDSLLGYTLYLAGHTIGLVFLLGPNLVIAARVLGLAPDLPLRPLAKFRPLMAAGLALTVLTGLVLFATDPINYVRNIVFLVKIAAIAGAVICLRGVVHALFGSGIDPDATPVSPRVRHLTAATLVFWTISVVAGRLTAYSGVVVLVSIGAFLTAAIVLTAIGGVCRLVRRRRPRADGVLPIDARPAPVNGGE